MDRRILDLITKIGFVYSDSGHGFVYSTYLYKNYSLHYNEETFVFWLTIARYADMLPWFDRLLTSDNLNTVYATLLNEFKEELRDIKINNIIDES